MMLIAEIVAKTAVRILEAGPELSCIFRMAITNPEILKMEDKKKPILHKTLNVSTASGIFWRTTLNCQQTKQQSVANLSRIRFHRI